MTSTRFTIVRRLIDAARASGKVAYWNRKARTITINGATTRDDDMFGLLKLAATL